MSGFAGGLLNPLLVPAHAVALLGLALLIGGRDRWWLPLSAFGLALGLGLGAIAQGIGQTPAVNIVLTMAALTGILAAAAWPIPMLLRVAIAAVAGGAIGLDSPPQAVTLADATAALVGTWISACLVLVLVVVAVSWLTRPWQRIGIRIIGSWITASAILVLALRYARGMLF